jgi:hypothetical protein
MLLDIKGCCHIGLLSFVYKPPLLSRMRFLKCVDTVASGVSTFRIRVPSWLASRTIYELKDLILSATVRMSLSPGNWMLTWRTQKQIWDLKYCNMYKSTFLWKEYWGRGCLELILRD